MLESRFPVELIAGVPVIAAPAEIDVTNSPGLRAALLSECARGHGRFVLDMSGTRFCDASGARALAAAHRRALADGRQLFAAGVGAAVLRVLELTGVAAMIPCFDSLDDALGLSPAEEGHGRRAQRLAHIPVLETVLG